jgi:1,2-diacylglycerol 3-alpha-glucosyltransferase
VRSDNSNPLKRAVMNLLFQKNVKVFKKHKNFAKTGDVEKELENLGITDTMVVPVGLDTSVIPVIEKTKEQIRADLHIPQDGMILLYVGRMDPYKRPQLMLSLLKELKTGYGIMIGDGELSVELERGIEEAGLASRVKWIRKLANEQVQSYYAAADYLVNFNDHEIFGMSILEAMYQGLTVIAFHAPGPDTIIEDGISGYLVSDLNEMTDIVRSSKSLPKSVIQSRIKMSFTWDTAAACFDEWIRKATDIEKSNHNN